MSVERRLNAPMCFNCIIQQLLVTVRYSESIGTVAYGHPPFLVALQIEEY